MEQLTEEERVYLTAVTVTAGAKALRIIDALTTRVAELEARRVHVEAEHKRLFEEKMALLDAANARAEAAEQKYAFEWKLLEAAESEVAALRAEVEQLCRALRWAAQRIWWAELARRGGK